MYKAELFYQDGNIGNVKTFKKLEYFDDFMIWCNKCFTRTCDGYVLGYRIEDCQKILISEAGKRDDIYN